MGRDGSKIGQLWLADIRENGAVAFRVLRPMNHETAFLVRTAYHFAPEDYSGENALALRTALAEAVIGAGLYEDEAEALLESAQAAYLTSPGLRLFYITTRIPGGLRVSVRGPAKPAEPRSQRSTQPEVKRVTLERIEMVSPTQRALLAQMAGSDSALGTAGLQASALPETEDEWTSLYRTYLQLGAFRNPLVLDEQKRRPTQRLQALIERFRLQAHPLPSPLERRRRN